MFVPRLAKAIVQSGMLNVVRRLLFTSVESSPRSGPFDFQSFYQQGTAVALLSEGQIYLLTASHVVRNATNNLYANDSPFWVTRAHEQPSDLLDFLLPDRFFDCSPGGEDPLDVAVIEVNPFVPKGLTDYLNWDDSSLFVNDQIDLSGCTAVVIGYPEEVNPYQFPMEDEGPLQVATFARATFRGELLDSCGTRFANLSHREGYEYAGLSGGTVIAATTQGFKYVGMVVSSFDRGKQFTVIPYADIRKRIPSFTQLQWEVVDEAYFMRMPTHIGMNYIQLQHMLGGQGTFTPERSNLFLEQIERSVMAPPRSHWASNLNHLALEARRRILNDLVTVLRMVAARNNEIEVIDPIIVSSTTIYSQTGR